MLKTKPITLKEANEYVDKYHRHNKHTVGHKFSVSVVDDGNNLHGVAICGRPISRHWDDGETLEINRVCTDGYHNACSFLYGVCCRIGKEMGYKRIVTYTLETEDGASLRASGFRYDGEAGGGTWDCPSRKREIAAPTCKKKRWVKLY